MPQAAAQEHDHDIDAGSCRALSTAAKGDVQIPGKEAGQGFVPALPEFRNGQGAVGLVKVGGKFKIHHFSQSHCHVAVAAEVEINLEGVGQHDQSRADRAQSGNVREAPVRHLAEAVGNQHLLGKAQRKQEQAGRKILPLKPLSILVQKLRD